jgi:hypothetical protein
MCCFLLPRKADPVLIIDPQAVLPAAISLQCFQAIAGRDQEIGQCLGAVECGEAPQRNGLDAFKFLNPFAIPQSLSFLALKAPDHLNLG